MYNLKGCDPKVGKPAKIEISTETLKGVAGIRFYPLKKNKGASVVLSRVTQHEFTVVKTLLSRFIKPILNLILTSHNEHVEQILEHLKKTL